MIYYINSFEIISFYIFFLLNLGLNFINETNSDIKDLLISFSNGYEIEIDKITTQNNKSSLSQKINLKEIPNTLSKNRFNKLNEIKITHILQTKF